jgi:hypothetical protein
MLCLPFFRSRGEGDLELGRLGRFRFSPVYRVPLSARAAHMYVIGLSGKGKSKFLEHCLFQDISQGRGCGLIDPHSLLVDDLLRLLITKKVFKNPSIRQRLIYVDPAREDYTVPFNVLAIPGNPYDVATSVLEAFRRTWPESLQEAPHFSNVVMAALIVLIENGLTLMDMPRLLTNQEYRAQCLSKTANRDAIEFFTHRFEKWGRDAPVMRESTLNKVGAFSLNPRLKLMLGQHKNNLDFRSIMDGGNVLLLDLGRSDGETNRLIGNLVTTGLELAMRRREKKTLWNLTIDEFAGYVANEGSVKTLAHVFSEGRKFRMSMTVAHQDLSQLTPRMIGAISNVQTKVVFGIGRSDAEFFAKMIGRVDPEVIKQESRSEIGMDLFAPIFEQWEQIIDQLRFQPPRQAVVSSREGEAVSIKTLTIPLYTATDEDIEAVRVASLKRYGIPYHEALKNVRKAEAPAEMDTMPFYEVVAA